MSDSVQKAVDEFAGIERDIARIQARLGRLPKLIDDAGRDLNVSTRGAVRACSAGDIHRLIGAAFAAMGDAQSYVMEAHCDAIAKVDGSVALPSPKTGGR